ncbi:MAG: DHH family phosphoesterase [Oscillospiraceae bacterium]|jgi:c-di-AMP phosphodiesterase-like protein
MKGRNGFVLKTIVLTLSVCAVSASAAMINYQKTPALVLLGVSLASSLLVLIEYFIASRNIKKYILRMNREISATEKESLKNFPAPAVIIDEKNIVLWFNRRFEEVFFSEDKVYGEYITKLMSIDIAKTQTGRGTVVSHGGRFFRAIAQKPEDEVVKLMMLYFEDITELKELEKEHYLSHASVILIMIDNYEDLLQNVKESEKAHILVQLEKLLENFMEATTGVLRKISNDKFVAVLEERHLRDMISKRFEILDKARQIMVGDRLCVTLSIGVGKGASTLFESEVFAKQALDMALGRGGDQCAVKTDSGFEFFGGVSKGIEKHAKVKTRIIATALMELVEESDGVLVMGHRFGDLDSIGAATGVCAIMRRISKRSYVVVDPHKNLAKKLIKHITEQDTADMYISPENALDILTEKTLLVICDTHNPDFLDSRELYDRAKNVVVIDHHRKMVNFIDNAVIFHHEPYASSASEMVAELIQYFGENNKISAPVAEALLSGIMLDTKNFVMRTGVRTFEAAAFLRKLGADTVAVRNLFSSSIETYQQKSRLVANAEIYHHCAIASSDVKTDDMRIAAPQAADELLGISGVDASFVLFDMNGVVNISARSLGAFNVQIIMEALGGGGHQTMAGVQLERVNIESARQSLLEAIDDFIRKNA